MSEQNTPRNDEPQLNEDELESVAGGTNVIDTCGDPSGNSTKPWPWEPTGPTFPTEPTFSSLE